MAVSFSFVCLCFIRFLPGEMMGVFGAVIEMSLINIYFLMDVRCFVVV